MINNFKKYYNISYEDLTPPPPPEGICYYFSVENTRPHPVNIKFITCFGGGTVSISCPENQITEFCAQEIVSAIPGGINVYIGDECSS